ncbi:hypothetical protein EI546_05850 [Aequorivita sp. H23M31]|uniref:CUB domain-containing protein n=1 Tax=Aequorivita ciconiae TaxID=2494375 RepID=A0A410G1X2_9FLAO|nr:CUB domain-containing protein [Aequorivita sp. H23M31]QAA81278.1 hypothetical protein EI546_05850 [Aequorivita sp. H23M31]
MEKNYFSRGFTFYGGLFFLVFSFSGLAQVGIGNTDPKSSLDVSGAISLREGPALVLANNDNEDIDLGPTVFSIYRITGPTNNFNIQSFNTPIGVSASDGQMLTLDNTTSYKMTIVHDSGSAGELQRRIFCPNGEDLELEGENTVVTLQYNILLQRWIVNGSTDVGGYGKNVNSKVGVSDISTNSSTAEDMADMEIVFTPKHETIFVNFSASGTMDKGDAMNAQAYANFELVKNGVTMAGATTLASDRGYIPVETTSSSTPYDCREMFYDSGGPTSNYGHNEDDTHSFLPSNPGERISVEFITFNVENGWDGLMIYDGPTTSSPIISSGFIPESYHPRPAGAWTGTGAFSPAGRVFTSTHSSGALTFRFLSDSSLTYFGWEACVTSGTEPPNPCREMFYDRGGAAGQYPNNDIFTKLYSPTNPGEKVTVRFMGFDTEEGWDGLMIYDGPNASSPIISSGSTSGRPTCPDGAWSGTGSYSAAGKSFTSTVPGGQLYFEFRSDGYIQRSGWMACVNSIIPVPLDCREIFYDSGGENGQYQNYENITYNFLPTNAGEKVSVEFLSFNTEQGWDGLMVYDGSNTSAPVISSGSTYGRTNCPNGAWTGTEAYSAEEKIFTSSAPGGELTFVFRSDVSNTRPGWKACVNSVTVYNLDTAWNSSFVMYPVEVIPGEETTIKIQWSRDSSDGQADVLRNNVTSEAERSHRSLTIFD